MVKSLSVKDAKVYYEENGVTGKQLFESEKVNMIHLAVEPGKELELHEMPMDVIFFVAEGDGILKTEDGEQPFPKKTMVHVPKGALRAWKNGGDKLLEVVVFKFDI